MISLRKKTLTAVALASLPVTAFAASAGAAPAGVLPDDLGFLDTDTIDEVVASAENGSADCAALETVMGIALISSFASGDWDFGTSDSDPADTIPEISPEAFWGVSAPFLLPLLDRVSTDDPAAAALVEMVGPQLAGAVQELRDMGFTDDELLLIQDSWALDMVMSDTDITEPDDSALADLEARAEELFTYDFASITFLDEEDAGDLPGEDDEELPWASGCPETASMLDFDMEPVSATMDFEVTITVP